MPQLPKRYCRVEFEAARPDEQGRNAKSLQGVNVRFSIPKYRGQIRGQAKISVCNLAGEDIAYLTTYMSPWIEIQKQKKIRLFAGYENNNAMLFAGDILRAVPTQPPDVWLECEAIGGYFNNLKTESFTVHGPVTVRQLGAHLAQMQGLSFRCLCKEETAQKRLDNFCYTGGLSGSIKKLNDLGCGVFYVEDDILFLDDAEPELKAGKTVRLLTEASGLVGIPRPGPIGLECTTLLDPSIKLGEALEVRSSRIPSINGLYYPYALTHEGEFRGNEWYTKLKCARFKYG